MVKIFVTNIEHEKHAQRIVRVLEKKFSKLKFNIDLEDYQALPFPCGHSVLRAEGKDIHVDEIIQFVQKKGFKCESLEDKICKQNTQQND